MLFGKKIVIITHATQNQTADLIEDSIHNARRPDALRFAIPQGYTLPAALDQYSIMRYSPEVLFSSIQAQLTNEAFFLLIGGVNKFQNYWDVKLNKNFSKHKSSKILLTGSFWTGRKASVLRRRMQFAEEEDSHEAVVQYIEPCAPALQNSTERNKFSFTCGEPLLNYTASVRTMLVDPSFCYGEIAFLKTPGISEETLSYDAYAEDYKVYALVDTPILCHTLEEKLYLRQSDRRIREVSFQRDAHIDFQKEMLDYRSRYGIYPEMENAKLRNPFSIESNFRRVVHKFDVKKDEAPLCVTAVIDGICDEDSVHRLAIQALYLDKLKEASLLIYTQGSMEAMLRNRSPRTKAYPALAIRSMLRKGMGPGDLFRCSKLLMLLFAAEHRNEYSHICWLNANSMPHRLHEDTLPDFSPYMDKKIHIASVNDVLDASMFIMPRELLESIKDDLFYFIRFEESGKQDYSEERMWQHLYHARPEDFCIHSMPMRGLLFLTVFDSNQISAQYRRFLPLSGDHESK